MFLKFRLSVCNIQTICLQPAQVSINNKRVFSIVIIVMSVRFGSLELLDIQYL